MAGRYFREDFDRGREFISVRPFKFNGVDYVPGDPIDTTDFPTRRLRQMYDMRYVGYPEQSPGLARPVVAGRNVEQPNKAVVVAPGKKKVERYRAKPKGTRQRYRPRLRQQESHNGVAS